MEKILPAVACVCVLAILAINVYQFICDKNSKKLNGFLWDRIERPFYNAVPMLLVLLGSVTAAKIMTVFMLVFVCAAKCVFDRFAQAKNLLVGQIVSLVACAAVFAGCFADVYSPFILIVAGIVPYLIAEFAHSAWYNSQKGKPLAHLLAKTSFATVYPCFVIQSAAILYISYKIFGF